MPQLELDLKLKLTYAAFTSARSVTGVGAVCNVCDKLAVSVCHVCDKVHRAYVTQVTELL